MTVGVAVSGVAACGQQRSDGDPPTMSAAEIATVEDRLDAVDTMISGTGEQQGAALFEINYAANHPIEMCMNAAGFDYNWTFVDPYTHHDTFGEGADTTLWLMRLGGTPISSETRQQAPAQRRFKQVTDASARGATRLPEGYDAAMRGCEGAEGTTAENPRGHEDLRVAFTGMLADIDDQMDVYADDYSKCMAAAGWDTTPSNPNIDVEGWMAVQETLRYIAPDSSRVPEPGEPPNPNWDRLLAAEADAVAADATCRRIPHDRGITMVAPQLAAFEAEHAAALQQVQAGWDAMVSRAKEHGWRPGSN